MLHDKIKVAVTACSSICLVAVLITFVRVVERETRLLKPFFPLPSELNMEVNMSNGAAAAPASATSQLALEERGRGRGRGRGRAGGQPLVEVEALAALRAALEMRRLGKPAKALKLFRHAYALAPALPDVLVHYGEFLEQRGQRGQWGQWGRRGGSAGAGAVVAADQLYTRALRREPAHAAALAHRQRTASLVDALDRDLLAAIDAKRDRLLAIPDSEPGLCRAKREAYYQHIYHTVGIEGNTMTLEQTRSILETRNAVSGKSIAEHNEILGLDLAMRYINETLLNSMRDISLEDILEIHRRVLGHVDPVEAGRLRRTQVWVGGHTPPPPDHIPQAMEHLVSWLNSDEALQLHPVRLGALAHYKLVHIHPFVDGNGRTARLLMNVWLMRGGLPPAIVPRAMRAAYYRRLRAANDGDLRPFVRLVARCLHATLDLYLRLRDRDRDRAPSHAAPAHDHSIAT